MRNLNEIIPAGSGWLLIGAEINDSGWIVGYGTAAGWDNRPYLLRRFICLLFHRAFRS
jgi:hypothetical protein